MSSARKTQRFIRYLTDTWKEIVRYDTAHGRLHIHRFWPPHRDTKEDLESEVQHDYTIAVTQSLRDLHSNWETYRNHVERE